MRVEGEFFWRTAVLALVVAGLSWTATASAQQVVVVENERGARCDERWNATARCDSPARRPRIVLGLGFGVRGRVAGLDGEPARELDTAREDPGRPGIRYGPDAVVEAERAAGCRSLPSITLLTLVSAGAKVLVVLPGAGSPHAQRPRRDPDSRARASGALVTRVERA
jgi:hypothetical protein